MRRLTLAIVLCVISGCASYTTPGGPAELAVMRAADRNLQASATDPGLQKYYDAQPQANFPAMIAMARVQSSGYHSRTASAYGSGAYALITTRDVEKDDTIARLSALPNVRGLAPISRLLVPPQLQDEGDLRAAAARVKSDILVLYTFDTKFFVRDFAQPVSMFTLGLSPNKKAYVTTTASAILLDTRTGFVYGGAESTAKSSQLANGWTSEDAVDDTRLRTERESFDKLVAELEKTWAGVVRQYAPAVSAGEAH